MSQEYGFVYAAVNSFCMIFAIIVYWKTNDDIGSELEITYFRRLLVAYIIFTGTDAIWAIGNFDIIDFPMPLLAVLSTASMVSVIFVAFYWFAYGETKMGFSFKERPVVHIITLIPIIVTTVLYVISIPTGLMFSYTEQGYFIQGPLYNLGAILGSTYLAAVSIHAMVMFARATSSTLKRQYLALLGFIVLPVITAIVDTVAPTTPVVAMAIFSSVLFVFASVQESQIFNDALTGLNNRRRVDTYFDELVEQADADNPFYLFMIDADQFKDINDNYGHIEGDRALVTMAHALRRVAQEFNGFVARYGGDEFVVLVREPDMSDPERLVESVDRCLVDASKEAELPYVLRATVGWSRCDNAKMKQDVVVRAADAMLYERKLARCRAVQAA